MINPTNTSKEYVNSVHNIYINEKGKTDQKYWNKQLINNKIIKIKFLSNRLFASGEIFFTIEKREFFFDKNSIYLF